MIKRELVPDKQVIKNVFPRVLDELFEEDSNVVYLDADLMNSFGTGGFAGKYPENAFDMGIQESNMIGVAAGMSSEGKIPYVHTFGPFASRRVYDQVFMSAAYGKNSIRIIGSDPGVTAAYNGGTHMPFEDVALYRAIPESTIFDIVDAVQFKKILKLVKNNEGVTYIRSPRKSTIKVYDDNEKFEIGEAKVLKDGQDVAIVATGIMVAEALLAAYELEKKGIDAAVIDPVTIKPLDEELICSYAKKTGALVTAENSNVNGGLYDAIAGLLAINYSTHMARVGIEDEFGEVGTQDYLQKRFGLTKENIIKTVTKLLK